MAAFIAKQMVGDQLKSVKGALGDKDEGESKDAEETGEDPEIVEARREAEEKRKEKHRIQEAEREELRQSIRDKYGLKKKDPVVEEQLMTEGRIGRKKKSPAELAAENNEEEDEDEFSTFPTNLSELQSKVSDLPSKIADSVGDITQKCVVQ
ncbi:complexin-like isoform X2 [Gigantopelta aegis]|uniref:complexin-like isoform X2 n=1 Tax=Gigantopelta aegis TaxID=1735272 RepID=UPI001B888FB2|nr:complexin-like isoform X2 [Gigantopelta aegis]